MWIANLDNLGAGDRPAAAGLAHRPRRPADGRGGDAGGRCRRHPGALERPAGRARGLSPAGRLRPHGGGRLQHQHAAGRRSGAGRSGHAVDLLPVLKAGRRAAGGAVRAAGRRAHIGARDAVPARCPGRARSHASCRSRTTPSWMPGGTRSPRVLRTSWGTLQTVRDSRVAGRRAIVGGCRAIDLVAPPGCCLCLASGGPLCGPCLRSLPLLGGPLCERCGMPTARGCVECRSCRGVRLGFASARSGAGLSRAARAIWCTPSRTAPSAGWRSPRPAWWRSPYRRRRPRLVTWVPADRWRLIQRGYHPPRAARASAGDPLVGGSTAAAGGGRPPTPAARAGLGRTAGRTCATPSVRPARRRLRWCWSTTCTPPARPCRRPPARCARRAPGRCTRSPWPARCPEVVPE